MKYLILGIITQLSVIFSIHYIFRYTGEGGRACAWSERGAKRGVLVFGHNQGDVEGSAKGRVEYRQTVVQWDELVPVLSGIKDHVVFGQFGDLDSILNSVQVVIYVGPDGFMDKFKRSDQFLSFTYPNAKLDEESFIDNDKFVFEAVHKVLSSSQCNDTIQVALTKKVLFILYLTSMALAGLKHPNNETMIYEAGHFLSEETSNFQKHLRSYYSDEDTVFISVPHWSILKEKNSKLSVWGRGVSGNLSPAIELADVCPLLASLLGVAIPLESVGRLPLSYLNMSQEEEGKALGCNALQLHQLVFPPKSSYRNTSSIIDFITKKQYSESLMASEQIVQISQSYLHRSQKTFDEIIFSVVLISLIGWIFVLITIAMVNSSTGKIPRGPLYVIITIFITIASCEILYIALELKNPLMYMSFIVFSLLPWVLVLVRYKAIWDWCLSHANLQTLINIFTMLVLEEALNLSFNSGFLTVFFITVISSLPLLPRFHKTPFLYSVGWYATCGLMIALLNIPVGLLKARRRLINLASTFWLCLGQSSVFYFKLKYDAVISQILVIYVSLSTILANAFVMMPYPQPYWYYFSWFSLTSFLFPLMGGNKTLNRLIHFSLSFGPSLLLMSRHIESLSYLVLVTFFACWVYLERSHLTSCDDPWGNLRRGSLLVFSCCLGYLLIGKIEDHSPTLLLTPFMPIHFYLMNPIPYYAVLFFKHLVVQTTLMTIYISLIKNKWKTDLGFEYGLIFIEMICLRSFVQFLFFKNFSELVLINVFFNMFAICYMVSYCLGQIYSTQYVEKEPKDLSILYFLNRCT